MISNYYIYYNFAKYKDTLFVYFDTEQGRLTETRHYDVSAFYAEDGRLHCYSIYNINKILRIKTEGFIYKPHNDLIKVINFILENSGFETLKMSNENHYVIGKVINNDNGYITVSYKGKDYFDLLTDNDVAINSHVVIALDKSVLSDFTIFKCGTKDNYKITCHICKEKDLIPKGNYELINANDCKLDTSFF